MKLEKMTPGMLLHSWGRNKTSWPVLVVEIDLIGRRVLASWNSNPAEWVIERNAVKWRKQSYREATLAKGGTHVDPESAMKTAKPRKVWVTGKFESGIKLAKSRKEALKFNPAQRPIPFIEQLPGSVMLSRENVAAILRLWNLVDGSDYYYEDAELRALLRSRR